MSEPTEADKDRAFHCYAIRYKGRPGAGDVLYLDGHAHGQIDERARADAIVQRALDGLDSTALLPASGVRVLLRAIAQEIREAAE